MVDLEYLTKLLPLLKSTGVDRLKMDGLEVAFWQSKELSEEPSAQPIRPEEAGSPHIPNLAADDTLNFDKILHWSGSPDDQGELPLAGDEPLGAL